MTDRSHSAVRNILTKHGVIRRGAGAVVVAEWVQHGHRGS
ncbi:hypothetical protein O2W17_02625 [Blastococcus sp. VKM Ac-2987]|nr:hypothetical protein [Blastococcus sp. VKM Ac-2987]MCZ2857429.1 hypothetical protein [Blastococcus sp. VKM Ac-2987]